MNHAKGLSPSKITAEAAAHYGKFYCSEAIVNTIVDNMELDIPKEYLVAMSSGFPGGVGGSKCMCGAVSGGIMALGLFFGRSEPGDEKIKRMMGLSSEVHDWFKKENEKNTLCCRILTRNYEWEGPDHKKQCALYTGMVAGKIAEILIRELELENLDEAA